MTKEDVLNEARAIDVLRENGTMDNLVSVTSHGWLSDSPYYYIDMELCHGNLEDYIENRPQIQYIQLRNPRLHAVRLMERGVWNLWDIMEQIASGVEFIHACKQVHRDLKPRNSNHHLNLRLMSSLIFCIVQGLESR